MGNKLTTAIDLYSKNKISEANEVLESIILEKINIALEKRKEEISLFSEGDIKVNNKKKKNRLAVRAGRTVNGISAKHSGRTLFRTLQPSQLKSILATEGTVKDENKKHKREVEKTIGKNLEKNHGGGGGLTGRLVMKTFPSSTIKALSKKTKPSHWTNSIGFYRTPVTENLDILDEAKPMPYKDVHKMLTGAGFKMIGQDGTSHVKYKHPVTGQTQTVSHHKKEVSVGIVRQVLDKIKEPKLAMEQYKPVGFHKNSTTGLKRHLRFTHPIQKQRKNRRFYKSLHNRLDRK